MSPIAVTELDEILELASSIGVPTPSFSKSGEPPTRVDIAWIVLNALQLGSHPSSLALAKRAGIYLASLNSVDREESAYASVRLPPPPFNSLEKARSKSMFLACKVGDSHKAEIQKAVKFMVSAAAMERYKEVSDIANVPWFVIAAVHYREANLNFFGHLHNGDRLDRKTRHIPPNRPRGPWPPPALSPLNRFDPKRAWLLSAVDALTEFKSIRNWTVEEMLYGFERYNGFGFRRHDVPTPYVWSYSQFYSKGGYPKDREWKDGYVSKQAGLGLIIKALAEYVPDQVRLTFET